MHDSEVYLEDILKSIRKIKRYSKKINSPQELSKNDIILDAVCRNLEIIGEAAKSVDDAIKKKYSDVEWKKIAGLRDILIHAYSSVDTSIVWDIIVNKIPQLKKDVSLILKKI